MGNTVYPVMAQLLEYPVIRYVVSKRCGDLEGLQRRSVNIQRLLDKLYEVKIKELNLFI